MSHETTTFVHQVTVIEADWCNDVDHIVHEVFPGSATLPFFKVDDDGNKVLNNSGSALSTNATAGFVYMPTSAGIPAGTPATSYTGAAPLHIDSTNNALYMYTNSAWRRIGAPQTHRQWIALVAASQTSNISTGTAKATIRAMPAGTITDIRGFLATAGTTSSTFDVNINGTSIMTTNKLLIDANETTTLTASTLPTLTTTAIAEGDVITVDIDTAGTNAKGWGVLIEVEWTA